MFYGGIKTPLEVGGFVPTYQVFLQEKALTAPTNLTFASEVSIWRLAAFHLHRSLPPDCLQLHFSCLEMNNCSDPLSLSLGSVPAERLAGKISFPPPCTAAGELLLPVSASPVTTILRCQAQMTISFSFPPSFSFLGKIVLRQDGFLSSLGLLENYCWHQSREAPWTALLTYSLPMA